MNIHIKPFAELTPHELYAVLQLRSAVFVVEQQCAYQDVDNQDLHAKHILLIHPDSNKLAAYARALPPTEKDPYAHIGRVVVAPEYRGQNLAHHLMHTAIAHLYQCFGAQLIIDIQAQSYLSKFYRSLGFETCSAEYLEDGIPHCDMRLSPPPKDAPCN